MSHFLNIKQNEWIKYNIQGVKVLYFCKAAELINTKNHLTLKGFNKIQEIKLKWIELDIKLFKMILNNIILFKYTDFNLVEKCFLWEKISLVQI